jgi:hypothetical protein
MAIVSEYPTIVIWEDCRIREDNAIALKHTVSAQLMVRKAVYINRHSWRHSVMFRQNVWRHFFFVEQSYLSDSIDGGGNAEALRSRRSA